MLKAGPAQKVTIHLNEDTVASDGFLYDDIFTFLFESGVSGATLFRPAAGFGSHHRVNTSHLGAPGETDHLPVRIEFIELAEKVSELLPRLCEMVTDGMIEVQDAFIHKVAVGQESV